MSYYKITMPHKALELYNFPQRDELRHNIHPTRVQGFQMGFIISSLHAIPDFCQFNDPNNAPTCTRIESFIAN
jgi:hypothetical protein